MPELTLWVITRNPRDFPARVVVRRQYASAKGLRVDAVACVCDTVTEARASIPPGAINLGRQPGDDPVILEVWI